MDLPVIYLTLEDIDGLTQVSFVEQPAIEENFHAFSASQPLAFAIQDEEKRIITGPAMLAEKPIYRRDSEGREFFVKFSAETIEKAVKRWAQQGRHNAVNVEHSTPIAGAYLMESFITDPERGINAPEAWKDAPAGSWFVSYYIADDALWAKVKAGEFKGFSIEGFFSEKQAEMSADIESAIADLVAFCNDSEGHTLNAMDFKAKVKQLRDALTKFSEDAPAPEKQAEQYEQKQTLVDGTPVWFDGEMLVVTSEIKVQTPEGEWVPAPDGVHELDGGIMVTTVDGVVSEISEVEPAEGAPEGAEEMGDKFAAIESKYADLVAKFEAQASAIDKLTNSLAELVKTQSATIDLLDQFSAIPAAEPVKKPAKPFSTDKDKREANLAQFAANLQNLKNNK
jgi:hypothetical protein